MKSIGNHVVLDARYLILVEISRDSSWIFSILPLRPGNLRAGSGA